MSSSPSLPSRRPAPLLLLPLAAIAVSSSQAIDEPVHHPLPLPGPVGSLGVRARQREVRVGHPSVVACAEAPHPQLQCRLVVGEALEDVVVRALQVAEAGVDLGQVQQELGPLLGRVVSGGVLGLVVVVVVVVVVALEDDGGVVEVYPGHQFCGTCIRRPTNDDAHSLSMLLVWARTTGMTAWL